MLLVHQNTGKENRYGKNFFAVLISTLGRFDRAYKKKVCHIHFKVGCTLPVTPNEIVPLLNDWPVTVFSTLDS